MRLTLLLPVIALTVGALLGLYLATASSDPTLAPTPQVLVLSADDQTDYILNVAEAYAADANLKLAQDRLVRLQDPKISARIETLALEYAPQHSAAASNLARLSVALGSHVKSLVALYETATPSRTPRVATNAPVFSNVRATVAPPTLPPTETPTAIVTAEPKYVVVPNDNPYYILPTNTFTPSPTRRPATRTPTPTITPSPTAVPPPPYPVFEPDLSLWWGTIHYEPANVEPGQGYWHLAHAIYCDAFPNGDGRRSNFGCDEMPGGSNGTNIYVMSGGNEIDVYSGGENVADNPAIVGEKKKPGDMCNCDYSFEDGDYRISVRGGPSDAIGGFCLCGKNFGWGSRAHVRYFLYFEYRIR